MKKLVMAAIAAVSFAAPAMAEDSTPMWEAAPVLQVQREIEAECRRMGLHARIVPDFLFAVDADGDGEQDDAIMFASVAQCADSADLGVEATVERAVMCRADACRQWLVINDRRGYRLAWTGFTPTLSGVLDLRLFDHRCNNGQFADACPRVYWNGRAFTQRRPRVRR